MGYYHTLDEVIDHLEEFRNDSGGNIDVVATADDYASNTGHFLALDEVFNFLATVPNDERLVQKAKLDKWVNAVWWGWWLFFAYGLGRWGI